MKKHKEKHRRKGDTSENKSSHMEEGADESVASVHVKSRKMKKCMKHRVKAKRDDAQPRTWGDDSQCSSAHMAGDDSEQHRKRGAQKKHTSEGQVEDTNVAQNRDVGVSPRTDVESMVIKKKKRKKIDADDGLTPTGQQCGSEEEAAKSEHKSGRAKKRTAADVGSNRQDIEPPPAEERCRKKRKHREMSDVAPERLASPDGTFTSESSPVESRVNADQSPSSKRKKKKKKRQTESHPSEDDQGGITEETLADTRSKECRKQKKRSDLERKGLPSEPSLASLRPENAGASKHRRSKAERTASRTHEEGDELDNEMWDEDVQHVEDYNAKVKFMSKFICGFAHKTQMQITTSLKYDYHRFKEFEKKGINVRFGRYTKAEMEQLKRNVNEFIRDYDAFTDPRKLFLPTHYPEEKQLITKYRLQNNFYSYLVQGISRPINQIFHRGMTLYEGNLKSGRYSEDELKQLIQLTREFGPHWTRISQIMQRGQKNLSVKFSLISNGFDKGFWSDGEAKSLLQAMKDYLQAQMQKKGVDQLDTDSEQTIRVLHGFLYSDIPWKHISTCVRNRNSQQCRKKWMGLLAKRLKKITPLIYGWRGNNSKIQLIQSLYNMEVEDGADIDWNDMSHKMKMPAWLLQKKFYELKVCHVPNWKNKIFGEIIDLLHDVYLPQLLKKCDEVAPASSEVEPTEVLIKDILKIRD